MLTQDDCGIRAMVTKCKRNAWSSEHTDERIALIGCFIACMDYYEILVQTRMTRSLSTNIVYSGVSAL